MQETSSEFRAIERHRCGSLPGIRFEGIFLNGVLRIFSETA